MGAEELQTQEIQEERMLKQAEASGRSELVELAREYRSERNKGVRSIYRRRIEETLRDMNGLGYSGFQSLMSGTSY